LAEAALAKHSPDLVPVLDVLDKFEAAEIFKAKDMLIFLARDHSAIPGGAH
jgi:hypothetical protein